MYARPTTGNIPDELNTILRADGARDEDCAAATTLSIAATCPHDAQDDDCEGQREPATGMQLKHGKMHHRDGASTISPPVPRYGAVTMAKTNTNAVNDT